MDRQGTLRWRASCAEARQGRRPLPWAKRAAPKPHRWLHRISSVERALSRAPPRLQIVAAHTRLAPRAGAARHFGGRVRAHTHFAPLDGAAGAPVAAAAPAQRRRQQPHYSSMSSPLGERRADEHARTLPRSGTAARQPPLQTNTCHSVTQGRTHVGKGSQRVTIPQGFHRAVRGARWHWRRQRSTVRGQIRIRRLLQASQLCCMQVLTTASLYIGRELLIMSNCR